MRTRETRKGLWLARARRGSVAVHIGLMMIAIIGMAALGSEIVFLLYKHRQMQMVADAAALSASTALSDGYPSDLNVEARAIAAEGTFVHGVDGVTVTVNNPPVMGPNTGNNQAVEVIVDQPQTLYMMSLFRSGTFDVGARAVALVGKDWRYCLLALDPTAADAFDISNNGVVSNPSCGVASNSNSNSSLRISNNGAVNGPVSVVGNWSLSNNADLNGTPLQNHAAAIPDPYVDMDLQTIPSCTAQPASGGGTISLTPGHFCTGWNYGNNVTVNLAPGFYYIDQQLSVGNNAILNGTGGVTIIVNGNYAIQFSNNVRINITAPSTGPYAGMAFFGTRTGSVGVTQTFSNNSVLNIKGVVYFPSQTINFQNNGSTTSGGCTQVIGRLIRVSNNVNLDNNCAGTGVQPLGSGNPYLAE
ncbi:MAG TPA: hypothetical protein VNH44_18555 [Micropepsaceae bacterium]|nr:hypothetical protein [Micropepsaceae bacterium]